MIFDRNSRRINRCFTMLLVGAAMLSGISMLASVAIAQAPVDWRVKRRAIDRVFADDLQEIAGWCRTVGLPDQVKKTFELYSVRDLNRQTIFLPSEKSLPVPGEDKLGQWLTKINDAKRAQAARILGLATEAAEAQAGAVAFQLLHEVIHYDRDHELVRKILGHKKTDSGWRVTSGKIQAKTATSKHKELNWPARTYLAVRTPHFQISSNATEAETLELANKLERWHYVWRQVFFDYWSKSSAVKKWIKGDGGFKMPTRRFEVALFKSHDDYVKNLSRWVKGVEESNGYYRSDLKLSFFPAGDDPRTEDTWRHELCHQLFRESIRSRESPFADGFLWLDEGIAMYFESLADFGDRVTLGGFDARRMQFARVRRLRENDWENISTLAKLSQKQFQSRSDKSMLYSQSAGIAHMLMDDNHGARQPQVIEFMKLIHKGRIRPETFQSLMVSTYSQLDEAYLKFLAVDSAEVVKHLKQPESRTELCVPGAKLNNEAFAQVGKCINLEWLDVTGSEIQPTSIDSLRGCTRLKQLFLTNCSIEPSVFAKLSSLKSLKEIDFSLSSIGDSDIQALQAIPNLSVLRLARTRITDNGLTRASQIRTLEIIDVTGAKVSAAGISAFARTRPDVQIVK